MPKELSPPMPAADSWLWKALQPQAGAPLPWLRERFPFVVQMARAKKFSRVAAIVPERGTTSRLAAHAIDSTGDAKFVLVYARDLPASGEPGFRETLTYGPSVAGTDLVYDLTGEFLQGKARPFVADFRRLPLRVYAVLPYQVERIHLAAQQHVLIEQAEPARISIPLRIEPQDAAGSPIAGFLPIYLGLRRAAPIWETGGYTVTGDGQQDQPRQFVSQVPSAAGDWSLVVRSQLTGDELSLPLQLSSASRSEVRLTSEGLKLRHAPDPVENA